MIWWGVWRFAFTVIGSSLPIVVGGKNSQTGRTDFRGSGHAGSGLQFEDRGTHPLKGIPEDRQLYALA